MGKLGTKSAFPKQSYKNAFNQFPSKSKVKQTAIIDCYRHLRASIIKYDAFVTTSISTNFLVIEPAAAPEIPIIIDYITLKLK